MIARHITEEWSDDNIARELEHHAMLGNGDLERKPEEWADDNIARELEHHAMLGNGDLELDVATALRLGLDDEVADDEIDRAAEELRNSEG